MPLFTTAKSSNSIAPSPWRNSVNLRPEIYRAKIENLSWLIYDRQFKAAAFGIMRSLIDEVRLIPENGDLRTELKGELAGISSLCAAKKRPAPSYEERAEQIKLVAGARNHRELTLRVSV